MTVLGTVIGLGALVATLGLSLTASSRIVGRFDELSATVLTVTVNPTESGPPRTFPWDAPARITRLNGAVSAGNLSQIDVGDALVSASPINDPQRQSRFKLRVLAASPDLFTSVRARLRAGRFLDAGYSERAERVAVLGPNAAASSASATSITLRPSGSVTSCSRWSAYSTASRGSSTCCPPSSYPRGPLASYTSSRRPHRW